MKCVHTFWSTRCICIFSESIWIYSIEQITIVYCVPLENYIKQTERVLYSLFMAKVNKNEQKKNLSKFYFWWMFFLRRQFLNKSKRKMKFLHFRLEWIKQLSPSFSCWQTFLWAQDLFILVFLLQRNRNVSFFYLCNNWEFIKIIDDMALDNKIFFFISFDCHSLWNSSR